MSTAGDVTLRDMTAGDTTAGLRLSRASGWNQTQADWRFLLEENRGRFVAAVRGDRVVGTGGATCYGNRLAWVCMILVDEEERGQGLGSRIVAAVLERVGGTETVGLDATPSGRPVYERLGFTAASGLVRVGGAAARASRGAPGADARPVADAHLEDILALDREAFGAERERVIRWARSRSPQLAWCAVDRGRLAGYCFGRDGDRAVHVGPIVARGVAVARALLARAAASAAGRDLVLDVPTAAPAWMAALRDGGLVEQRPFTRMYRGSPGAPGRAELTFAAFGPELG